jgi:hypothetical protein
MGKRKAKGGEVDGTRKESVGRSPRVVELGLGRCSQEVGERGRAIRCAQPSAANNRERHLSPLAECATTAPTAEENETMKEKMQ